MAAPRNLLRFFRLHIVPALLILVLASSLHGTPPTPPVTAVFLDKVQQIGSAERPEVVISILLVGHVSEAVGAVLEVSLRPDAPGIEAWGTGMVRTVHREQLELKGPEARLERNISIKVGKPGAYYLTLMVAGKYRDGGYSNRDSRYLVVAKDGEVKLLTPRQKVSEAARARRARFESALQKEPRDPNIHLLFQDTAKVPEEFLKNIEVPRVAPEHRLMTRPTGPSENLKGFYVESAPHDWRKRDPITVSGRLVFQDFDGAIRPVINASVNLWDDDFGPDEHLGVTVTDWSGNWSFTVDNDDGWLADGRDIYYTFKTENTRFRVQNCSGLDSTYEWQSSVHDDLNDGTVLDFGTETAGSDQRSLIMFNHLNGAWNAIVTMSGQDPGFVDSCFPYDSTDWDSFWEEIDAMDADMDGPDSIFHEYGHALMYYAYGEYDNSPGGDHGFDDMAQDRSLSWSEGWATGWMLMARPDGVYNWHEGQPGRPIENFSASNRTGEQNEGRVAAALVDFFDSSNDNNGGNQDRGRDGVSDHNSGDAFGLDIIYRQSMWGARHDDVSQFFNQLSGNLGSTQLPLAREIMNYNWMAVSTGTSCVATKIVTAGVEDREKILSGLRHFRDLALSPVSGGQMLALVYYRNSPEMGVKLMKDEPARKAALVVMRHFSQLGDILSRERENVAAVQRKALFLPPDVEEAAKLVVAHLHEGASPELSADMELAQRLMQKVHGMTIQEVQEKMMKDLSLKENKKKSGRIDDFHPASRDAIRKYPDLPKN